MAANVAANPVPYPLALVAAVSWALYSVLSLAIGGGYACWNTGILRGHLTVPASASYATPVLSSALGALLLGTTLTLAFWQGVVCVAIGSLLGWWAIRPRAKI